MSKQETCKVTERGRACGRPSVGAYDVPDLGRVPVCATHKAAIDANVRTRINEWARQLASGASVHDLK